MDTLLSSMDLFIVIKRIIITNIAVSAINTGNFHWLFAGLGMTGGTKARGMGGIIGCGGGTGAALGGVGGIMPAHDFLQSFNADCRFAHF